MVDLQHLFESVVTTMGFDLVGVERAMGEHGDLVRVYIDHPSGITLDDCAEVSRQVSALLDVEDPSSDAYTLEVSSPGLDRPLFTPAHYRRFLGATVRIVLTSELHGRRRYTGTLLGLEDETVELTIDGEKFSIPLDRVRTARLVPQDL